jgi:hypothetical protein
MPVPEGSAIPLLPMDHEETLDSICVPGAEIKNIHGSNVCDCRGLGTNVIGSRMDKLWYIHTFVILYGSKND